MKILKTLLLVLLYILLIAILLVIGALIFVAPILLFGWTYLQSAYLLGGILLGILLICSLITWNRRRREKAFVRQVITEDEATIQQQPDREREAMRSMQTSWKEAIRALQQSKLRRQGNPLYVLPWYMILGDPGSGKSSAARGSRLMSTLGGVPGSARLGSARLGSAGPCEWWFLEQAILLDVKGSFTAGAGEESDGWFALLDQLARYRVREPIDGVIVTVPADLLAGGSQDAVGEYGRRIRHRLDSLIRKLGHRFPVYVMITKADHLLGMNDFLALLPDRAREQGMGILNDRMDDAPETFVEKAIDQIGHQLRDLRLLLLHRHQRAYPDLMCMPDEVLALRGALNRFVRAAFQENPYQIAPQFRGLFLSSACRSGAPLAQRLHDLGLPDQTPPAPKDAGEPAFLRDFFGSILPRDRGLYTPIPEFLRWRQLTRNIGFIALLCVGGALCALLSASFLKTAHILRAFQPRVQAQLAPDADAEDAPPASDAAPDILASLVAIHGLNATIEDLERENASIWWTRPFLLPQSRTLATRLKTHYVHAFHDTVILPMDHALSTAYGATNVRSPRLPMAAFFEWLVRRTNLARRRKDGRIAAKDFSAWPAPSSLTLRMAEPRADGTDLATLFPSLFERYYLWSPEREPFVQEHMLLHARLLHFIDSDAATLQDVVTWANVQDTLSDITMTQYWGPAVTEGDTAGEAVIERGHTKAGRDLVSAMLAQFRAAVLEYTMDKADHDRLQQYVDRQMGDFGQWYVLETFNQWLAFARALPEGMYRIRKEDEMRRMAQHTAALNGPYWSFISLACDELPVFVNNDTATIEKQYPWLALLLNFRKWRNEAPVSQILASSSTLAKLTSFGKKVDQIASRSRGLQITPSGQPTAGSLYVAFQEAMANVAPAPGPDARNRAYDMTSGFFTSQGGGGGETSAAAPAGASGGAGGQKTPGYEDAFHAYEQLVHNQGAGGASEQTIWGLFRGPIDINLYYGVWASAMVLQAEWEKSVLADAMTAPRESRPNHLFDPTQGTVWTFVKDKAAPFLSRNADGYYPVQVLGMELPFANVFVPFINQGLKGSWAIRDSYPLAIAGLPTGVNERAREMPYAIVLTHQKPGGATRLKNLNYPVMENFEWKMDEGGDVELQIQFIGLTLIKNYRGTFGMIGFAHDFRNGASTFHPADFPESRDLLEQMGIREITVRFAFNDAQLESLLRLRLLLTLQVPDRIVRAFGTREDTPPPSPATPPVVNGGSRATVIPETKVDPGGTGSAPPVMPRGRSVPTSPNAPVQPRTTTAPPPANPSAGATSASPQRQSPPASSPAPQVPQEAPRPESQQGSSQPNAGTPNPVPPQGGQPVSPTPSADPAQGSRRVQPITPPSTPSTSPSQAPVSFFVPGTPLKESRPGAPLSPSDSTAAPSGSAPSQPDRIDAASAPSMQGMPAWQLRPHYEDAIWH